MNLSDDVDAHLSNQLEKISGDITILYILVNDVFKSLIYSRFCVFCADKEDIDVVDIDFEENSTSPETPNNLPNTVQMFYMYTQYIGKFSYMLYC